MGSSAGGEYRDSKEYGRFIVWPSNLKFSDQSSNQTITATAIGKRFSISANKTNFILSELGWLKKDVKGWIATAQGLRLGAVQAEDRNSGIPYVRWPESITSSKVLIQTMNSVSGYGDTNEEDIKSSSESKETDFRHKYEAKHRATDGHFVRSKAEMLIDNYLYMAEIVHAYERKLPIEEDAYCDFYLPTKKVYIEYWGYDNDQKYLARKKAKIALYEKYGFNLIQLEDKHVQNLDDVLPKLLLKYGITAY
ncbi:MAG TPA: glycerol kinase [Bacteroidetes bacterium]|nr:glycerol kinase [Bacteroidota bacterium]HEX05135.1 glycerol kinase [Bacteroidota bacterium]